MNWPVRLQRSWAVKDLHRPARSAQATELRYLDHVVMADIPGTDSGHRTYAQMTSEEKNKISHRRRAVEAMRNGLNLG